MRPGENITVLLTPQEIKYATAGALLGNDSDLAQRIADAKSHALNEAYINTRNAALEPNVRGETTVANGDLAYYSALTGKDSLANALRAAKNAQKQADIELSGVMVPSILDALGLIANLGLRQSLTRGLRPKTAQRIIDSYNTSLEQTR